MITIAVAIVSIYVAVSFVVATCVHTMHKAPSFTDYACSFLWPAYFFGKP